MAAFWECPVTVRFGSKRVKLAQARIRRVRRYDMVLGFVSGAAMLHPCNKSARTKWPEAPRTPRNPGSLRRRPHAPEPRIGQPRVRRAFHPRARPVAAAINVAAH